MKLMLYNWNSILMSQAACFESNFQTNQKLLLVVKLVLMKYGLLPSPVVTTFPKFLIGIGIVYPQMRDYRPYLAVL